MRIQTARDYQTELLFSDTVFQEALNITTSNPTVIDFTNAEINAGISIISNSEVRLRFNNCKVKGHVEIKGHSISEANFEELTFLSFTDDDKFIFKNCTVKGEFTCKGSKLSNAIFNETTFSSKSNFDKSLLKYSKKTIEGNFINTVFEEDAYFNYTIFDSDAFFNGSEFKESVLFISMNNGVKAIGDFSGVIFHKRAYFNFSLFEKLIFHNTEFIEFASFQNLTSINMSMSRSLFLKGTDFLNSTINYGDRETFRIIKNEFLKINNSVEALHYRSKEMTAYEKELTLKKDPYEFLLLRLNRISNLYGLSWSRGVSFTFGVALLFYILYLLTLSNLPFQFGWNGFNSFWSTIDLGIKYFIRFFIITHDFVFMEEYKPSSVSYIVDFFGKIFIGYGIYQTVQAFRKHGKS